MAKERCGRCSRKAGF